MDSGNAWRHFWSYTRGTPGILRVESEDAGEHTAVHRTQATPTLTIQQRTIQSQVPIEPYLEIL
jgi:hypothetical protein